MRIGITLQQLEAFVEVAKTVNFRLAAQALHVSQPALSRTIKMVEETLRTRLFDRDTRHVEITDAGRELLPIALRILENFNGSFSELAQFLEGRRGHVTVVALPSAGVALLPNAIAAFRKNHPQIEFALLEGPAELIRAAIDEGRADLAISVRPAPRTPLLYQHLLDDPMVLLCRRDDPLAVQTSASWSVFSSCPFIASSFESSIRPITDAAFLQKGLQITPSIEYPSIAAAGALVAAGLGVTALPRLALHLIKNDDLASIPASAASNVAHDRTGDQSRQVTLAGQPGLHGDAYAAFRNGSHRLSGSELVMFGTGSRLTTNIESRTYADAIGMDGLRSSFRR